MTPPTLKPFVASRDRNTRASIRFLLDLLKQMGFDALARMREILCIG